MYFILRKDIQDAHTLIEELKKRNLVRSQCSCQNKNYFAIATWLPNKYKREYIFLSERMCCNDPRISWTFNRIQCTSQSQFLQNIDNNLDGLA